MGVLPVVIGIDQARLCGWAVLDVDGERVDSGTWTLARPSEKPVGRRFEALLTNVLALVRWCERRGMVVKAIAYEDVPAVALRNKANMRQTIGYMAIVEMAAARSAIPTVDIPPQTAKATAGYGRAGKPYMVRAANERWDLALKSKDDNTADALWIAEAARRKLTNDDG